MGKWCGSLVGVAGKGAQPWGKSGSALLFLLPLRLFIAILSVVRWRKIDTLAGGGKGGAVSGRRRPHKTELSGWVFFARTGIVAGADFEPLMMETTWFGTHCLSLT